MARYPHRVRYRAVFFMIFLLPWLGVVPCADADRGKRGVNDDDTDDNQRGGNPAVLPWSQIDHAGILLLPSHNAAFLLVMAIHEEHEQQLERQENQNGIHIVVDIFIIL